MEVTYGMAERLVRQMSNVCQNQIGIINNDGFILAHTSGYLRGQQVSAIETIISEELPQLIIPSEKNNTDSLPGIYLPIKFNNESVCYLLVHYGIEEDILSHALLLQEICRLNLEVYISGHYFNLKNNEQTSFCVDWLDNAFSNNPRAFEEKANVLNIDLNAGCTCVILHLTQIALNQTRQFSITEELSKKGFMYVLRFTDFVIILNTSSEKKVNSYLSQLRHIISKHTNNYLIAQGQSYKCTELYKSYQEALQLVNHYGESRNGIIIYKEELLNIYLYNAPSTLKKQFVSYIFPDYSTSELSNIIEFIHKYFDCNGSITQMAKEMFVHKNTINYRIDNIKKRTGYDLRNISDCYILHTACLWTRI